MRATKEMAVAELEQLKRPEARETAAFDASELQSLIDASREDDDLALPIEPAVVPASSASSMPVGVVNDSSPRARRSLLPWILVAIAAAIVIALALWE